MGLSISCHIEILQERKLVSILVDLLSSNLSLMYTQAMSNVVAVLSRKGGVGKTVTAMYCAQYLTNRGHEVSLLDRDPEGSAVSWAKNAVKLPFAVHGHTTKPEALKQKWLVVDTPPNDAKVLGEAARLSTIAIIVAKCNALEADRLIPTLDALAASGFDGKWGILLTQAKGGLGREMREALEAEDLPVLGVIPNLIKYERSFGEIPLDMDDYGPVFKGLLR